MKVSVLIQKRISHLLFLPISLVLTFYYKFFLRYKFDQEKVKALRREYQKIVQKNEQSIDSKRPILLCSNHLTLIDSLILVYLLNSPLGYILNFKSFPWSLPEKRNFYHKISWKIFCYLGKSIPVIRGGGFKKNKKSQDKINYLLRKGETISIFPEGKRSRSGRVDRSDFSYAAGELITKSPTPPLILCLYLRGEKGGGFGKYPPKGESFYFELEKLTTYSLQTETNKRRARDLSTQIIEKLASMEERFFRCNHL